MNGNNKDFSMEDAKRLASTPAGQQLIKIMQQGHNAKLLQNAAQAASQGDYSQLKAALGPMLNSEDVQKLLRQLGG